MSPDEIALILIVLSAALILGMAAVYIGGNTPRDPKPRYRRSEGVCHECGLIGDRLKWGLCEWCRGVKG